MQNSPFNTWHISKKSFKFCSDIDIMIKNLISKSSDSSTKVYTIEIWMQEVFICCFWQSVELIGFSLVFLLL